MAESKEHKTCKRKVAKRTGWKTERYGPDGKRRDVYGSPKDWAEVVCKRNSKGKMNCNVITSRKQVIPCECF